MRKQILFVIALISALFLNAHVGAFAKGAAATSTTTGTEVKSYTRKDGTKVKGYTRKAKGAAAAADTQDVKGYTRKDGTKVAGYTRKKASKAAN